MNVPNDDFHDVLTMDIRLTLGHYFPKQSYSRKPREGLIKLLLDNLIGEEVGHYARLTRRDVDKSTVDINAIKASVHRCMDKRYTSIMLSRYFASPVRTSDPRLRNMFDSFGAPLPIPKPPSTINSTENVTASTTPSNWPQLVPEEVMKESFQQYRLGTQLEIGPTCAVCARRSFTKDTLFQNHVLCTRINAALLDLTCLQITDEHILARGSDHFDFGHDLVNGLALDKSGVHVEHSQVQLDICQECKKCLTGKRTNTPALSLANGNIRGYLPEHLRDCTWLEERLCAKYLASAYVIRLYDLTAPNAPEHRPRVMKGHACSFPLNTISTATKLPWAIADGGALLSCLVIGPRAPRMEDLRNVFKVRKQKVHDLLLFLRENFKDYPQFPIDEDTLGQLPDDDVPELLMRNVLFTENDRVRALFETETTGIELHPALAQDESELEQPRTFLEHHGMLDVNGTTISAQDRSAAALANATGSERPDLVIRHGTTFIQDYKNPGLFPGMYPTLFPWGTGGFESSRSVPLSFTRQSSHLLDLADEAFRRHWSYIFIVANIKSRRLIHLGTRLVCKARNFNQVSTSLQSLDLDAVKLITQKLSKGITLQNLDPKEKTIMGLLKQCELVSNKVPGSKAMMNRARGDIRGYVGEFGIFQLFLTLNPSPIHSPVFQIFYGDQSTKLELRVPSVPKSNERGIRVANDPVAASDYFHFHIQAVFKYLFGWDSKTKESTEEGGIFGHLAAFFLVKEHTMRGQLHGHALIWLKGGINPSRLRRRMQNDTEFQKQYLAFFDSIIHHHIPPANVVDQAIPTDAEPTRFPRQECPPDPDAPDFPFVFEADHRLLGDDVQRHSCRTTCFKGGRTSCRFLFPHELNPTSHYDIETNSINLRIKDPVINWHNPALLVATRHNHDLKSVQSGRSGLAAASYITSYATKSEETPANQISMIQTVLERMASLGQDATELRGLLSRCVMQFGRERQVHAQQAATYVRDLGDTYQSHNTIAMLSGRMMLTVVKLYGAPRKDSGADSEPSDPPSISTELSTTTNAPAPVAMGETDATSQETIASTAAAEDEVDRVDENDDDDSDDDDELLPLSATGDAHQVDDYFHRGDSLQHLSFYDFVRFCKLIKVPRKANKNHHALGDSHPNIGKRSHRYNPDRQQGITRAIFSTMPRSNGTEGHGDSYCASMLSHFKPFGIDSPLKTKDVTYEEAFRQTNFSDDAKRVMDNWMALTECDDARDAEQLLRRKREACRDHHQDEAAAAMAAGEGTPGDSATADVDIAAAAAAMAAGEGTPGDSATADVDIAALMNRSDKMSAQTLLLMANLASSHWFDANKPANSSTVNPDSSQHQPPPFIPTFTAAVKRKWTAQLAEIEAQMKATATAPRATTGALAESLGFGVAAPATTQEEEFVGPPRPIPALPTTVSNNKKSSPPDELIRTLIQERNLTASQALAFKVAARHFFTELTGKEQDSLRLFMHGEAGTGKTVVVRLLRELLERFGKGNEILFMAPTGKAASAIGGATQHATFALRVQKKGTTSDDLASVRAENTHANRIRYLQDTFRHVRWLFFDEVSMTSCEMMAEIDQALRIGRQLPDDVFGRVNVLFAGDLCQLAPVGTAALYSDASLSSRTAESRTMMELGRAAWLEVNEVINFTEQMRMQDVDMAESLSRLRVRKCTEDDASLFNTNVLRSSTNLNGINLQGRGEAIVLTRTNETVRALNHQKAAATAKWEHRGLVVCAANDTTTAKMTAVHRSWLLNFNGDARIKVGLGRIPLYEGMPVVYRGGNQSVSLGITNGAFATVHSWQVRQDNWGHTVADGIILHFPNASPFQLESLPERCLPIIPASTSFKMSSTTNNKLTEQVKRKQLPIQPGFAMTVHSAQGITSKGPVIVDLRTGGFGAYVAATRATKKADLILVAPIKMGQLNTPPLPKNLRSELKRLDRIAAHTRERHDHDDWTLDGTELRNKRSREDDLYDQPGPSVRRRVETLDT